MAGTVEREWKWDLNVKKGSTNEQSVKVVAWDSDSATALFSLLTDVSGNIVQQKMEESHYAITLTDTVTPDAKTPHVISCVKWLLRPLPLQISFVAARRDTFFVFDDPYITQTTKATVAAYTGITISHVGESITISQNHTWAEVYDYCMNEAYDSPQKGFPGGIMTTVDGNNFQCEYDIIVSGASVVLSGQDKTVVMASGKDVTFQSGGKASDFRITGDLNVNSVLDLSDVDVSGDTDFTTGGVGSYSMTDCQFNTLSSTTAGVILNALGDSSYVTNNNPTNITWNQQVTLQVKVQNTARQAIQNAQTSIRLADSPFTQLMNEDTLVTGIASEGYNYGGDVDVEVRVRKSETTDAPRYKAASRIETITAAGLNVTVTLEVQPLPI